MFRIVVPTFYKKLLGAHPGSVRQFDELVECTKTQLVAMFAVRDINASFAACGRTKIQYEPFW